jgi:hypothetical protein
MRRVLLATLPFVVVLPHHVPAQSSAAPAASYRGRLLGVYDCVFRRSRSLVSAEGDHLFRLKAITCFG